MPNIEPMTHWAEWREAVARTGLTVSLAKASRVLQQMDAFRFDPAIMEQLFAAASKEYATKA